MYCSAGCPFIRANGKLVRMEAYVVITREGGISLDAWCEYVVESNIIKLALPRNGINPFTKQPVLFKPPAGSAGFDAGGEQCSIEYKSGELLISVPNGEAMKIVEQVAASFNAGIRET